LTDIKLEVLLTNKLVKLNGWSILRESLMNLKTND
jgi:hypothetical protein